MTPCDIFYDLIGRYDYFGYFGFTTNAYHTISLLGDCFKNHKLLRGTDIQFLKVSPLNQILRSWKLRKWKCIVNSMENMYADV